MDEKTLQEMNDTISGLSNTSTTTPDELSDINLDQVSGGGMVSVMSQVRKKCLDKYTKKGYDHSAAYDKCEEEGAYGF